ncbi:hypothetical protein BC828DRAFT_402348 [Blastocladiella britannica]|nr:hypothetical protein BC828DRAFT_402348 [Blastocladiella britannica]
MLKGMLVMDPPRPARCQAFDTSLLLQACHELGTIYSSISIGHDGKWHALKANPKEQARAAVPYSFAASNLDPAICLATAWHTYDMCTRDRRGDADSVLLTKQSPYGPPMTQAVSSWVKTVMLAAGLPPSFTAKDIRASVTTEMIVAGATTEQVVGMLWMNWHTPARYYNRSALPIFGVDHAANAVDSDMDDGDVANATPGAAAGTGACVPL